MSASIRSCPGCKSLILADTYECPDCGHTFDEQKAEEAARQLQATRGRYSECPRCGENVRSGMVRCWSCNAFMREDVEQRYLELTTNPQPVIYSEAQQAARNDFLPARDETDPTAPVRPMVLDADDGDDGFTLGSGVGSQSDSGTNATDDDDTGFELAGDDRAPAASAAKNSTSASENQSAPAESQPSAGTPNEEQGKSEERPTNAGVNSDMAGDDFDLAAIAQEEERESRRRKKDRIAEAKRKRILIPCECGAWIRVREEQAGRNVRCARCKKPTFIPEIKKRTRKAKGKKAQTPEISIQWVENALLHFLNPTELVLKPGSLKDGGQEADVAFVGESMTFITAAATDNGKKKSLFNFGKNNAAGGLNERRTEVRKLAGEGKSWAEIEGITALEVSGEHAARIKMVQPIAEVHESMFAGVPVFGDGRIAFFLPVDPGDGSQVYCSLPLTAFQRFRKHLQAAANITLPAKENGVPEEIKTDGMSCFLTQNRIESARDIAYLEEDPEYTLALSGHKCEACGIAITEDARKDKKLGGANGKGLAKAKCPKCEGKFGNIPLFRIEKQPELEEQEEGEAPAPEASAAETESADATAAS